MIKWIRLNWTVQQRSDMKALELYNNMFGG